jgi:hypothetical protein
MNISADLEDIDALHLTPVKPEPELRGNIQKVELKRKAA